MADGSAVVCGAPRVPDATLFILPPMVAVAVSQNPLDRCEIGVGWNVEGNHGVSVDAVAELCSLTVSSVTVSAHKHSWDTGRQPLPPLGRSSTGRCSSQPGLDVPATVADRVS